MVTESVLKRTFRLKYASSTGTCFTLDIDGRQYLITAKHVTEGIRPRDAIEMHYQGMWRRLESPLIGEALGDIDITVLALETQLSPMLPLPAAVKGSVTFGQEIYFLGFPYDLAANVGAANRDYSVPLSKGASSQLLSSKRQVPVFSTSMATTILDSPAAWSCLLRRRETTISG